MPIRLASVLILSLALITSACSSPMKTPDIKQNLHPTKRYEITLTIDGAPGPFDSVTGFMQYEISNNDDCVPKNYMSGVSGKPEQNPRITFTQVGDHVYKGIIYTDLMQDDDYYGLGVCHWGMTFATGDLKNKNNKIFLSPNISIDEIVGQKSVDFYFPIASYTKVTSLSYPEGGAKTLEAAAKFPSGYFKINVSSKEVKS